ncbi:MAG: prepilin-type N-terminal cleavage/methylation domain-containing protein [Candidatus Wallbacteria bacterium]|nr:prepilin-type N-terminal cleavage/methylation domain-containing protein [Candidatus Wallbacteria bacterium]
MSLNKKAFTFIELMVAMGIAGIVMTTVYQVYSVGMKWSNQGFNETALQIDVRTLLEEMSEDLQYASKIEEFKSNRIKFKKFFKKDESTVRIYGDQDVQDIAYEIVRAEGKYQILRYVDIDKGVKLTVDEIDENVFFTGYVEKDVIEADKAGNRIKKKVFRLFDSFVDDSADREKISLIRIDFKVRIKEEVLQVITKVGLPYIHNQNLEPYWNGGRDL